MGDHDNGREPPASGPPASGGPKGPIRDELRPALPKRFYRTVTIGEKSEGSEPAVFSVLLDGRLLRTPLKRPLRFSRRALAELVADEWAAQATVIDPATMHATRILNSAIDGVADKMADVAAEVAGFAGNDLLCYRAEAPRGLVDLQDARWEPVLQAVERTLGCRFVRVAGIMHSAQPTETLQKISAAVTSLPPIKLAALHVLTTLSGSVLLALAVLRGLVTPEAAWIAAHTDEDWQISQWGEDQEASARRALRALEFATAAKIVLID
ncbi:MAG: ATP12 family protein [Hyphomicrobium sp.]|nr:ATP12 family protein [Hyphomicrobium sp.]